MFFTLAYEPYYSFNNTFVEIETGDYLDWVWETPEGINAARMVCQTALPTSGESLVNGICSGPASATGKEISDIHTYTVAWIKIVSEYDQEIPQSQTANNPVAPRGRAAQPSQDTRKTK